MQFFTNRLNYYMDSGSRVQAGVRIYTASGVTRFSREAGGGADGSTPVNRLSRWGTTHCAHGPRPHQMW